MLDNVKKAVEAGHENVMLLAMSTLPKQPKVNTYQFREKGRVVYFKSFSQMEPHTKFVLHMLSEKGEKLDRIVILESREVRRERLDQWGKETATTLFVKRLWNYLGRYKPINISMKDELEELQETPADLELYQNHFPKIYRIKLEKPVYKLQQYFQGNYQRDSWEQTLIEAIKDASMAIRRCSLDGFDRAVRRIEAINEEKKKEEKETKKAGSVSGAKTVPEMDVVYQDIYQNYENLLGQTYRYVAQIRWCLDKQFLQQALTILEAKMPYEFVHSGLLYYLRKGDDRTKLLRICEEMYLELKDLNPKETYRMKDLNHYLIKDYCKQYSKERERNVFVDPLNLFTFGLGDDRREEVYALLDKYRTLCQLRNQMNHAAVGEHAPDGFFSYMKQKYKNDPNWEKQKNAKYEKKIRNFLDEWEQLAEQVPDKVRNQVDDAS